MKKLAFEVAGNFEMPKLQMVGLEKGGNVMMDSVTVFTPQGRMELSGGVLQEMTAAETQVLADGASIV